MQNRRNVIILSAVIALYWFSQYMYMPFLTPYLLNLGLAASVTGVIAGAYGLTQLCFRFPIGIFADYSQQYIWIMRGGILLSLGSSIGFFIFQEPILLFAANFAQGLSSSAWLSFVILYSRLFPDQDYQKAMGLSNALNQGGIVGSYFVGGLLIDKTGIRTIFLLSAGVAIFVFVLTFFLKVPQETCRTRTKWAQKIKWAEVFGKETLFYSFIGLIVMFTAFGTAFSFTSKMAEEIGASGKGLAVVSIAFTIAAAFGSFCVSKAFMQRWRAQTVVSICLLIIASCCVGIGFAETMIGIVVAQMTEGIGIYLLFSYAMGKATVSAEAGSKSTVMGVFQTIYSAGIFLGPVIMGYLAEAYTLRMAYKAITLVPILGTAVTIVFFRLNKGEIQI